MTDAQILQAILNGQTLIREDIKRVEKRVNEVEQSLGTRIDKMGL